MCKKFDHIVVPLVEVENEDFFFREIDKKFYHIVVSLIVYVEKRVEEGVEIMDV